MAPNPFPFPLGIGIDICKISRIHKIISGRFGRPFIKRVLTREEWDKYGQSKLAKVAGAITRRKTEQTGSLDFAKSGDPELWSAATFLAGRFAAKEAAIKAHPSQKLTFHRIVIRREFASSDDLAQVGTGPVVAVIKPSSTASDTTEQIALLSISHDADYATAVCLGFNHQAKLPVND